MFKEDLNQKISFLYKKGFFYIIASQLLSKIINFGTTLVLISILSKELFGVWAYALNILDFFLLIQGIGVVAGILQYSSVAKDENERISFLKYGFLIGFVANIFLSFSVLIFTFFFDFPLDGSKKILELLFLIPMLSIIYEVIQIYFRASLHNKKFSTLMVLNAFSFFVLSFAGVIYFEVSGIVIGKYLAYLICVVIGIFFLRHELKKIKRVRYPDLAKRKEFLKFSIISALNNSLSSVVYLVDIFLIGFLTQNALYVATYQTATLIPFNLNFIPISIMIFAYPYFAKMALEKEKLKTNYYKMQKYLFLLNATISIILIVLAPFIIRTLFGEEYMDSVTIFRILCFGYFIVGTFRIPAGNVLASIKKVNVNLANTLLSGGLNIILNVILIKHFGMLGAAFATITVFIISSLISNGYLYYYFRQKNKN